MSSKPDDIAIMGNPVAYASIGRDGSANGLSFHLIKGVAEAPLFLMPDKSISASEIGQARNDAMRYRILKNNFERFRDRLSEVSEYEWDKILDDAYGLNRR